MIHIPFLKQVRNRMTLSLKAGLGFLILFSGAYVTYPYLTLWFIAEAIQDHDTAYLAKKLDWHAMKNELKTEMTRDFRNPPNTQDELPEFGNSFATTAINNAIDTHINNSSLHILIDYLSPPALNTDSSLENTHEALQIFKSSHIHFLSPITLQTQIRLPNYQFPLHITMKLRRGQWKITSINLPAPVLDRLFQDSAFH